MSLFAEHEVVTRIATDAAGRFVSVFVGRRRVARLPVGRARALGIEAGVAWTPELAAGAALALESFDAKKKAVALLRVRSRSTAEIRRRLADAGFAAAAIDAAVMELTKDGVLNDAGLAESLAQAGADKGLSSRGVKAALKSRGLESPGDEPAGSELDRALTAARNRAARLPGSLDAAAQFRRLAAALGRLGYEEDVARHAAASVLGVKESLD